MKNVCRCCCHFAGLEVFERSLRATRSFVICDYSFNVDVRIVRTIAFSCAFDAIAFTWLDTTTKRAKKIRFMNYIILARLVVMLRHVTLRQGVVKSIGLSKCWVLHRRTREEAIVRKSVLCFAL